MFFAYFSFKHIMYGHIGERKEFPNYVSWTSWFCYASATSYRARILGIAHRFLWLMSFSGEMVIYAFFLGFYSPSRQREWFKIWKIRDQPNHTNHIKEPQSSHCLIAHEDAHLSYWWYKVEKLCFKGHPRYRSTNIHIHTLFLYF